VRDLAPVLMRGMAPTGSPILGRFPFLIHTMTCRGTPGEATVAAVTQLQ
jgi:hypothetical protein